MSLTHEQQIDRFGMPQCEAAALKDWCLGNISPKQIKVGRALWLDYIQSRRVDALPRQTHPEQVRVYVLSLLKLGLDAQTAFDTAVATF